MTQITAGYSQRMQTSVSDDHVEGPFGWPTAGKRGYSPHRLVGEVFQLVGSEFGVNDVSTVQAAAGDVMVFSVTKVLFLLEDWPRQERASI